ncbi:MAG: hypothetical protein RRZ93_03845, partial [Ruthenibacterium sp.]
RIYQMQMGQDAKNPAGFLGGFDLPTSENHASQCVYDQLGLYFDDTPVTSEQYWAYTHQPGVQGTLWGVMNRALCVLRLPAQTRLHTLHFISVWLLCAALYFVCLWLWHEWGAAAAVLCGAGLLLSSWTLRACASLYWRLWLCFGIFALSAWLCRRYETAEKLSPLGFFCLGAAVCLRFLGGFEFASSLLVCMEVPFVYYLIKHAGAAQRCNRRICAALPTDAPQPKAVPGTQRCKWLRAAIYAGFAGFFGFALALLIWFVQLWVHTGTAQRALAELLVPIANRTGVLGAAQAGYNASLDVSLLELLRLYFCEDTILPGLSVLALLCLYAAVLAVTLCVCLKQRDKAALQLHAARLLAVCTGLLGTLSWLVLARGHASVHPHINYLLWLLPFVPLCLAHIGACAQELCRKLCQRGKGAAAR